MNKINNIIAKLSTNSINLTLARGKAKYKMSRGSFTTKDHLKDVCHLRFVKKEGNFFYYSNGDVSASLAIDFDDNKLTITPRIDDSSYNRFSISLPGYEDECIYGCGEQFTHFNLKGQKVIIWVSEHQQVLKIAKKFLREKIFGVNPDHKAKFKDHQTYYSSPTFMSSEKYFVGCSSEAYSTFNFKKNETVLSFREIPQKIVVLEEDNFLDLVNKINEYFGHQIPLPDWVNKGVILATQGGSEVMMEKYHEMKKLGCKISAVWCQDWSGQIVTEFGSQVYWNWTLDENHYKDMDKCIKELNDDGVKFLGYVNTFLKFESKLYEEAKANNYLVKKKDGSVYLIKSTTFDAGIVDLTNKEAYEWYKNIIKINLIGRGLSGWMADFGEYLPTDAVIAGGDAEKLHNEWPTLWAKCNYEAVKETNNIGKIFYFSRAAYGTTIKYTNSMWSGDNHVDYSDEFGIGSVISSTLSMALSGVGVNHSDIGGYTTVLHMKRTPELFIRWNEMNVFTPILRCHEGNRPLSNAQFNHKEVKDDFVRLSNLFASLKPYHDYVLKEYYEKGIPCNRPIFFHYNEEWAYKEQFEFMYGEDIIVTPVLRKNVVAMEVTLPKGKWVQFFTRKENNGGTIGVETPLGMPIAFYRKDSKFKDLFENIKL